MAQFPNTTPTSQVQAQAFFGNQATLQGLPNSNGFDLTTYLCSVVGNLLAGPLLINTANNGIGYATGAGSSVIQLVNKTSAITLNTLTGRISFVSSALAAYTTSSCTWTNSNMGANDVLAYNVISGAANPGAYSISWTPGAGSGTLWISNVSSGSLTEAPVIAYAIIKGAVS